MTKEESGEDLRPSHTQGSSSGEDQRLCTLCTPSLLSPCSSQKLVPLKQPVPESVASEVTLTAYLQDKARVSLWGCLGAGGATTPSMF